MEDGFNSTKERGESVLQILKNEQAEFGNLGLSFLDSEYIKQSTESKAPPNRPID